MRQSPSIVPGSDQDVHLVVDDLGSHGRVWRESDAEATDYETVIRDLLSGQYSNPVRVVSFNTAEGRSRDISGEVAEDLQQRCDMDMRQIPASLEGFIERCGRSRIIDR